MCRFFIISTFWIKSNSPEFYVKLYKNKIVLTPALYYRVKYLTPLLKKTRLKKGTAHGTRYHGKAGVFTFEEMKLEAD